MKSGNQLKVLAGIREMRTPFLLAFVGRLPLFMNSAALVLWTGTTGNAAVLGGFYVALLNIGVAVAGPWLGHLADRRGRARALRVTGSVQLVALGVLSFQSPDFVALNAVLCLVAGLATPPISPAIRSAATENRHDHQREAIFTGEAMVGSVFAIAGPLLLSGFILLGGAEIGLAAGAVLSGGAAVWMSFVPVMNVVPRPPEPTEGGAPRFGVFTPLRGRGFRALTVRMLIEAIAGGVEQVAIPAFALALGSAALTGPLWAIAGGVGLAAGAVYAVRTWRMPKETLYCVGVTGLALSYVPPIFADSFVTMALALSAWTILSVPVIATEYELVARTVPERQSNASFAIMTSAAICGTAVGAQIGGFVIAESSYRGAYAFAAVLAGIAAIMSWQSRTLWRARPAPEAVPA